MLVDVKLAQRREVTEVLLALRESLRDPRFTVALALLLAERAQRARGAL
jgi:hypothetical protein